MARCRSPAPMPPIEGTGETRLVLVLDPMTAPEEA